MRKDYWYENSAGTIYKVKEVERYGNGIRVFTLGTLRDSKNDYKVNEFELKKNIRLGFLKIFRK